MNQLISFVAQNWLLFLALAVIIALLVLEEKKGGINFSGVKNIDTQGAISLANHESALIVDVRPEAEFNAGHITAARNIPAADFAGKISTIEKYKDKPIILVCNSGRASLGLGRTLRKQGFSNVSSLSGGMSAWQKAGLPVVKK